MKRLLLLALVITGCVPDPKPDPFVSINCWLPNGGTISSVVTQEVYKKLHFSGIACFFEETATLPQLSQPTQEPVTSPKPSPEPAKRVG